LSSGPQPIGPNSRPSPCPVYSTSGRCCSTSPRQPPARRFPA